MLTVGDGMSGEGDCAPDRHPEFAREYSSYRYGEDAMRIHLALESAPAATDTWNGVMR